MHIFDWVIMKEDSIIIIMIGVRKKTNISFKASLAVSFHVFGIDFDNVTNI